MKAIKPPKNELREFYLEKLMSSTEIAKIYRCDPTTIRNYLKKYRIPMRASGPTHRKRIRP